MAAEDRGKGAVELGQSTERGAAVENEIAARCSNLRPHDDENPADHGNG